jgi:hypothetical protein
MWVYLLGPFLALLPRRWRRALPFHDAVPWHASSIVSGMAEFLLSVGALLFWYSYSVTSWVSRLFDNALSKSGPVDLTESEIGFGGLLVWATHPLTWFIAYFAVEGIVRVCAVFTDTSLGIFPLYVLEKIFSKLTGRVEPKPAGTPEFEQGHVASYVGTMREKITTSRLPHVPDELFTSSHDAEETLEIRSCRPKSEWDPPRVVRFEDRYYRLEENRRVSGPRPYVYKLRRLPAGVPGRTVLVYSPDEVPVIADQ